MENMGRCVSAVGRQFGQGSVVAGPPRERKNNDANDGPGTGAFLPVVACPPTPPAPRFYCVCDSDLSGSFLFVPSEPLLTFKLRGAGLCAARLVPCVCRRCGCCSLLLSPLVSTGRRCLSDSFFRFFARGSVLRKDRKNRSQKPAKRKELPGSFPIYQGTNAQRLRHPS